MYENTVDTRCHTTPKDSVASLRMFLFMQLIEGGSCSDERYKV